VTEISTWLASRSIGAPEALRARVGHYLTAVPAAASRAETLAAAANLALASVVAQGRDRAAALDLLAADALVTLSLLAEAEETPGALGRFAEHLVQNSIV
jgi:hypothetical protein